MIERALKGFETKLRLLVSVPLIAVAIARPALGHSLAEVEAALQKKEKFFQPVELAAPGFDLLNTGGNTVRLADLRGRVVVLNFIYTTCPDVCPLHTKHIAEVQAMVNRTVMKQFVQFVSITTDPTVDTPQALREYAEARGLDLANWTLLTTKPDQPENATRKLAESYKHKFTKAYDGYQSHGIVTHVIDKRGRWRANFYGLRFAPTIAVVFINTLVNDDHPSDEHGKPGFWRRVLDLFWCRPELFDWTCR